MVRVEKRLECLHDWTITHVEPAATEPESIYKILKANEQWYRLGPNQFKLPEWLHSKDSANRVAVVDRTVDLLFYFPAL